MTKRAAIYIRTSTERQADKVSPQAQEADCKALCKQNGYEVVGIYADTERYRSGGKLVEPSAKRSDRPEWLRLLADCDNDKFDVLVCWRDDRLYRGVTKAVIDLKERVQAGLLEVETVSGGFNVQTMEVLAWAAGIELEAKHERYMMGMGARFAQGKVHNHPAPYGYRKDDEGYYEIEPTEAPWVQKLFRWYGDGVAFREIRRRFVAQGAPQRKNVKREWHPALLRKYLKAEYYCTGAFTLKWNGETYEIPCPPLVTEDEWQRVQERNARYKAYPAGNSKHECLAPGITYCKACQVRMTALRISNGYTRADGTVSVRHAYRCDTYNQRTHSKGCARQCSARRVDDQIWQKINEMLSEPGVLESAIQGRIEQLQAEGEQAESDVAELERQLDDVLTQRQKLIGLHLRDVLTEDDLAMQLAGLTLQEKVLRRELDDRRLLTGDRAQQLVGLADLFREETYAGIAALNAEPKSEEDRLAQIEARRTIIANLIERVEVDGDKKATVHFAFDLSANCEVSIPASRRR